MATDTERLEVLEALERGYSALPSKLNERGRHRYHNAIAYVWGREDAGDYALRHALRAVGCEMPADALFANYAAHAADAYAREARTSLAPVQGQYATMLEVLEALVAGPWPQNIAGRTVWACCVSSIGPRCQHLEARP